MKLPSKNLIWFQIFSHFCCCNIYSCDLTKAILSSCFWMATAAKVHILIPSSQASPLFWWLFFPYFIWFFARSFIKWKEGKEERRKRGKAERRKGGKQESRKINQGKEYLFDLSFHSIQHSGAPVHTGVLLLTKMTEYHKYIKTDSRCK